MGCACVYLTLGAIEYRDRFLRPYDGEHDYDDLADGNDDLPPEP
jgi:hypothetical protein